MAAENQVAATVIQFHPSSTNLTAKIHPLVLFNICDSYVHRPDQADRVIGTLFGSVSADGTVDITNSYAVPHNESSDQTIIAEINHKIGASGVVSQECKSVVAQYGQEILDMLLAQTQPLKICSQIGLCELDGTQGVGIGIESVVNMNGEKLSVGRSNAVCNACEMAVVWMQNQIKQNQTQEQILNYINELCDRLPSPMGESAVDCGALTSMPSITFTIGGKPFNLTAEQMEALKQRLENTTVDSSNSQIRQESICSGDDYETVGNEEHAEVLT